MLIIMDNNLLSLEVLSLMVKESTATKETSLTKEQLTLANEICIDYIVKHNLIVYGGTALNEHLKKKNMQIYSEDHVPDIDFYSDNPKLHATELSNLLMKAGFQYVQRSDGVHKNTYKINIEFFPIFDITYISKAVFAQLPYVTINKVRYIDTQFLYIDLYKSLTNIVNIWRWEKDYIRLNILLKYFPLTSSKEYGTGSSSSSTSSTSSSKRTGTTTELIKILNTSKHPFLLSGVDAYNAYRKLCKLSTIPLEGTKDPMFHVFYTELSEPLIKLIEESDFTVKKNKEFIGNLPKSLYIYKGKKLVAKLYSSEDLYFNKYNSVKIGELLYTSFEHTLLHMYSSLLLLEIEGTAGAYDVYCYMISSLYETRDVYNSKNGINGLDPKCPFRILIDTEYNYKLNTRDYIEQVKYFNDTKKIDIYRPEKNYIEIEQLSNHQYTAF